MSVHCRHDGRGPALVLLHGWGFGGSVFDAIVPMLASCRTVLRPDLPGCGRSRPVRGGGIGVLATAVLSVIGRPAHWVGWSLGGLVALEAARRAPDRVTGVTLVAATPRMVAAPGWPGIDPGELDAFERSLGTSVAATHRRFLALQTRDCPDGRAVLRRLRAAAAADGLPGRIALEQGLGILRSVDLRAAASALSCPVDLILGGCDALVPPAVAEPALAAGFAVRVLEDAGHAPFVSHPDACAHALLE